MYFHSLTRAFRHFKDFTVDISIGSLSKPPFFHNPLIYALIWHYFTIKKPHKKRHEMGLIPGLKMLYYIVWIYLV